uniref:Uncharacterized protein n=1 Tax=Rhizochromulina marina TaxID=1034831 RepID=A0A7S2W7Q0_9STRA|mmetsp:Transcript_17314/g.50503  ORF Transcript_17314/g.50503 Transcript_17314/m.50503 type:complete len:338 (+) Transcript_17314:106-1119(+)
MAALGLPSVVGGPRVVVALMGIPGAGKSTLCDALEACKPSGVESCAVSFDEVMDELHSQSMAASPHLPHQFDPVLWKQSRARAFQNAQEFLEQRSMGENDSPAAARVVFLDDNLHYRSMRKEARRLARDSNAGLIILWVDCDIETAVERNRARDERRRVPEASITRIHAALEPPEAREVDHFDGHLLHLTRPQGPEDWTEIWRGIVGAAAHPVAQAKEEGEDDEVAREKARKETLLSDTHQFDLLSRRAMKDVMTMLLQGATKPEAKRLGSYLNIQRRAFLGSVLENGGPPHEPSQDSVTQSFRTFIAGALERCKAQASPQGLDAAEERWLSLLCSS